jgi:chemotaxis signal transduction protein
MLAIPLAFVREVVPADDLTLDGGAAGEEFASFVYRGSPLPAIRVGVFLGYREDLARGGGRLVVGEAGSCRFGLLVQGVAGVAEVPVQDILPLPDGATGLPAACFRGVWARGDRVVLLLEAAGLAALGGLERIGEVGEAPAPLEKSGVA